MSKISRSAPILSVSVAAELAGMHAQTVRQYDRMGLVVAKRTQGGGRRYSLNDVDKLIEIQRLSQDEGVSLAGIAHIFTLQNKLEKAQRQRAALERENAALREAVVALREELAQHEQRSDRVFAVNPSGDVLVVDRRKHLRSQLRTQSYSHSTDMTVWRPATIISGNLP
ncbi:heat shock protein transcriptional repressor HspR [Trueperella sp. LYQ143]|uniref:heat shock protein transcriptional repressor HspR n=1 Tax=unclassified Trueperella TaxID=2630174 RepID=UPI003983B5CC